MNTKFTKGEWSVVTGDSSNLEYNYLIHMDGHCEFGFDDSFNTQHEHNLAEGEAEANAHLIASAPDMYALLNDILNNYETDTHIDNQINVVLSKSARRIMNKSNRVNLFNGKLIKTTDISDAGLKRIAEALRELPPLECEPSNSEILDNCMDIINQERKPAKKKSSDNAIACGDVRNKRDDMLLEKLCMSDSTSDLMEFGKTL